MPIFNSSPINSSPEEYSAYMTANASPSLLCFVPQNNFDNMDYSKKTNELPQFVSNNSMRVEAIVNSMVSS